MAETDFLSGGLADPVIAGQSAFRAIMQAMAEPGTVHAIADCPTPPSGLSRTMASVATTLCDADTPIWLDTAMAGNPQVVKWLAFHTGAPVVSAGEAQFALGDWAALMPLSQYAVGTPEYPDRSATLIVEMERLEAAGARLTGPGIETSAKLSLPETAFFRANRALFPLGRDVFLTCGNRLAAAPRHALEINVSEYARQRGHHAGHGRDGGA